MRRERGPSSYGPFHAEEGNPLYRLQNTPATESAELVGKGRVRVEAQADYSNVFERDTQRGQLLMLDMERLVSLIALRYGVADRWEVGVRLAFETTWGGFLDGFIDGFHQTFGFPNADRERFPRGGFTQYYEDGDGTVRMYVLRRSFTLDGVRLFGRWQAWESRDRRHLVSTRLTTRIPTGENRVGGEGVDVGGALLTRSSWGPWHLHGMLGATTLRAREPLEPVFRRGALVLSVAGERNLWDGASFIVQYAGGTPYIDTGGDGELDGLPMNLILGFAGELGEGWRWQFSFAEDLPPNSPAVDFTTRIHLSRTW